MNPSKIAAILLFGLALATPGAVAHDVHLFATLEGEVVHGRAYFAGDVPAAGLTVNVLTAEGMPLGTTETDAEGRFTYVPEQAGPLHFVVETVDGHRASMTLTLAKEEGIEEIEIEVLSPASGEIEALIERAVAHEIAPVLEELNRLENRIRFQDVVGGIGYIVGLMGLIAYWKSRSGKGA